MSVLYQITGASFRSRLWACTAQNFRSRARSLPPEVAAEVLRASDTDVLIWYVPSVRELRAMENQMCSFVPERREGLVQLVCTNLSATADEAVEKALRGIRAVDAALIKLE